MIPLLAAFVVIFIVSLVLLYATAVYHNGYWRRRGIPGPTPKPFTGNSSTWYQRIPISFQFFKWSKEYGKVYGIQEGWMNVFVTSDVKLLHEIFVTKFEYFHGRKLSSTAGNVDTQSRVNVFAARGARWKRLRAIANPVFSVNNLKKVLPILHDSTRVMNSFFEKKRLANVSIDINTHFHELSMDVIMRMALGQKGSRQFDNVEQVETMVAIFSTIGCNKFHYYGRVVQPWFSDAVHIAARYYAQLTNAPFASISKFVEAEIHKRKAQRKAREADGASTNVDSEPNKQVDFIDLFLDIEDEDAINQTAPSGKTFDKSAVKVSKQLTVDEISAQCFVFLLAGFDTTANSLSATCHYLARNLEAQERLREEIINVCGDDEDPSYEQISQLRYTDAVMKETLRLCPIAAAVTARQCSKTTTVGPYTIEEGTYVQADVFAVQRDRDVWGEDADEFRPERWLEEGAASRASLNWMPFGAGPRLCIGMRLAYLEEKMALVRLLKDYVIRTAPDSEKEMKLVGDGVLSPQKVVVRLEKI